jgi:folylpolyglutamate synthase
MSSLLSLPASIRAATLIQPLPYALRSRSTINPAIRTAWVTARRYTSSYEDAVVLLKCLESNRNVVNAISTSSRDMNLDAIPEMMSWMRKAGYEANDLNKHGLNCIHIAGTKGKGSVCIMIESILMQYRGAGEHRLLAGREGLGKIGVFTSPHLIDVTERIRIDGSPIPKEMFARYFYELWDRFSIGKIPSSQGDLKAERFAGISHQPGFFRFLTILAFHAFIQEGVKTAIIECGIGGEYDSTNILPPNAVTATAITSLGIDHVGMLGDTIQKIAWHKAGIMKKGVPAYTIHQYPEAQEVLFQRAAEKEVELNVVDQLNTLEDGTTPLGLAGSFQVANGSLAIAVAASHLKALGIAEDLPLDNIPSTLNPLPSKFKEGLAKVSWPGRCQIIKDGNVEWHLDGAHTTDSIIAAADWFASTCVAASQSSKQQPVLMLIFNQQDRDAEALLTTLMKRLEHISASAMKLNGRNLPLPAFRVAAFCPNEVHKVSQNQSLDLSLQKRLAKAFVTFDDNQVIMVCGSIEEAADLAYTVSADADNRVMVLVTGSLYLVGGLLQVLEKRTIKAPR